MLDQMPLDFVPFFYFPLPCRLIVAYMMGAKQTIQCPLVSVSAIMREQHLEQVDFLKIDVERGELRVLEGISDADWPKIKQLAMEIHDTDGRLQQIRNVLGRAGFECIVVEQDETLQGSNLVNVYAS